MYICNVIKTIKMVNNKLTFEEFYDYVWIEYISTMVVPDSFYISNEDLIRDISYDIFHIYERIPNVSETVFAKILEIVFKNIQSTGVQAPNNNSINEGYDSFN